MPVLSIGGDKANGNALAKQVKLVATNASSVVLPNTGHWVVEENPVGVTDALTRFLGTGSSPSALLQMRMTPAEVRMNQGGSNQVGSSGLAGVTTTVLFGDPSHAGFYTIVLFVPAQTTIPAHSHRDDRMAAVVSGEWQFGYGDRFDEPALKSLPAGSVYSNQGKRITSHGVAASPSWLKSPALVPPTRITSIRRMRPERLVDRVVTTDKVCVQIFRAAIRM